MFVNTFDRIISRGGKLCSKGFPMKVVRPKCLQITREIGRAFESGITRRKKKKKTPSNFAANLSEAKQAGKIDFAYQSERKRLKLVSLCNKIQRFEPKAYVI